MGAVACAVPLPCGTVGEAGWPLSRRHATSDNNPLDVVERMASGNNWPFERAGEDEIGIVVTGRWTNYQVSFTWMRDIEALHLACAFDMKVPDPRLTERAAAHRADQRTALDRTFRRLDAKRRGDVPPCAGAGRRRRRVGPAMRGGARHARSIPASAISRRSSSSSGPANRRAKRWIPPCSRLRARRDRRRAKRGFARFFRPAGPGRRRQDGRRPARRLAAARP